MPLLSNPHGSNKNRVRGEKKALESHRGVDMSNSY